ncbi:unnamed protein product [Ceutorhynchus assimilis]|uniref:Transmembrane protein n=1 Tax=Ceutorhynchus assimilis TaxID=467358 RepID=A0A9N9MNU6_9CUCU|nr:unnamed protein product [Ceutorhynchus assimilis]
MYIVTFSSCKVCKNRLTNTALSKEKNVSDFSLMKYLLEKLLLGIQKLSPNEQTLLSAASGWSLGLLAIKLSRTDGRTLAFIAGGGLILSQIGFNNGYIPMNWNTKICDATSRYGLVQKRAKRNWTRTCMQLVEQNRTLIVGLLGGFLIGLATYEKYGFLPTKTNQGKLFLDSSPSLVDNFCFLLEKMRK